MMKDQREKAATDNPSRTPTSEPFGLDGVSIPTPEPGDGTGRATSSQAHLHGEAGGHEGSNDHLALIYESQEDQFEAVVPFLRQGLEQGERCLYIVDENTEEEVLEALREGGVDVDAARRSGALSIHTTATTYLRGGRFEVDEMLEFLQETLTEVTGGEDYSGFRATAEMSWALEARSHMGGEPNGQPAEEGEALSPLLRYEAMLNNIYSGEDCVALCQYNRGRFPAKVLSDILQTHPLVVYDGTVCRNVHYQSPDEFFDGKERPSLDISRTIEELVRHARTKNALQQSETRARQQEVVAELGQRALEEGELGPLLADAAERTADTLGVAYCAVLESVTASQELRLREGVGGPYGDEARLDAEGHSLAACTLRAGESIVAQNLGADARVDGADSLLGPDAASGIGAIIGPACHPWGVLTVFSREPEVFSDQDAAFVQSVANTLANAIERAEQERYQRELHEITRDRDRTFEETVEDLLRLGCDRFDLRGGGLTHLPSWDEKFVGEVLVGPEFPEKAGELPVQPDPGCFCRYAITRDEPTAVTDVIEEGWDDGSVFRKVGIRTYFGIKVTAGNEPHGTLWFYDIEPRDKPFTDDERTFLERIGRWVSDELERTKRNRAQRELYDITADSGLSFDEKIENLLELGCDRFGLDMGFFLEKEGDDFRVLKTRGTSLEEGRAKLSANSGQYCKQTITVEEPVGVEDVEAVGWDEDPLYREYDLGCYLGTRVRKGTSVYGSLCFADTSPREQEFTDAEYTFLDLMGQWLSNELSRKKHRQHLRDLNEITASPSLSFEEKLQALFDLGCEWFGLDFGALNRVDPDADRLQVEYVSDEHPYFTPGFEIPLSQTYCQAAADLREAASVSNPRAEGYDDITVYENFGVQGYFGTYVSVDGGADRTLAFLPSDSIDELRVNEEPFSEEERTCLELMGQWVKYELERKTHEAELRQSKERFERVFRGSHDPIFIVDPHDDDIVDANAAASEMLGYSRDELMALSPSDVHSDDMGRFRRFVHRVFEEGVGWSNELTCQPKFGAPIPAEVSASTIQIEGRQCMLAIVRDVSERREHERLQRRLYEIAASTDRSFDQKLDALFDLGCEHFDMEVGGLARVDPTTDLFEVEALRGDHDHLRPGAQAPLSETFCRLSQDREGAAAVSDPEGRGFGDVLCYEKLGVQAYLGTHIEVEGDLDRTFFFLSNEPREEPFSEAEQTVLHLMGQWVEYELNKKQREQELREVNRTLEQRVENRTRQVRELTSRVTMAEQRERERIARILHDGLQQKLYGIQLKMSSQERGQPSHGSQGAHSAEIREQMEEAIQMTRKLAVDMSPPVLDSDGLVGALEWLQSRMKERYDLAVHLSADQEFRVEEEMRVLLFQIVRELLFNVVKHAGVDEAEVELREEDGALLLRVRDDGQGFDPSKIEQSDPADAFGLTAARERLRPFGGDLKVEASPGEGTEVTLHVPLERL